MTAHDPPALPPKPVLALPAPRRSIGKWITWIVVIAILIAGYFGYRSYSASASTAPTSQPVRAVPVISAIARRGDLPIYIDGLGTVTPLNTVTVHTRVDGQLMKVNFIEGQLVHENDVLAEVDPRPFQVQLEQAQGQMAKDAALLKNARTDLGRYEQAREAIPQQQIDTASSLVDQYQAGLQSDQASIDSAKLQLTYAHITAPVSGRIGLRLVDQGNIVHASDANGLAVITQLQPISVVFSLAEDSLPQVFAAAQGGNELPVMAYSRDLKTKLATGKLLAIDNQIDPNTATLRFKAMFENKDQSLYPNQFVNVRLLVDTLKQAVIVPSAAIQRSPDSIFIYVIKGEGKQKSVEDRVVTLGPTEGDRTVITKGLDAGEEVVTDGADKLKPGMPVILREQGPGHGQHAGTQPSVERGTITDQPTTRSAE